MSLSNSALTSNDKKEVVSVTATEATEAVSETPSSSQVHDSEMAENVTSKSENDIIAGTAVEVEVIPDLNHLIYDFFENN